LSVGYRDDVAVLADGLAGELCSSVSLEPRAWSPKPRAQSPGPKAQSPAQTCAQRRSRL
jgi:hypothetical protein